VRLEKFQRNPIYEAIVAGGLDAHECELSEPTESVGIDVQVRISHGPSGSYFTIGGNALYGYTGTYVVGDSAISLPYKAITWFDVPKLVLRWAEEVKRDLDTPDLWAELKREREILTGTRYEAAENTPFTPAEQAEIAKQLGEIKEYVKKTYSLSSQQMSGIEARIDEASEAARRIGRKDWLLLFYGVMFSVIVTQLLPPEAVQQILAMALHGLDHLFSFGGTPPQLPPMA
jgi:hypothetical protein